MTGEPRIALFGGTFDPVHEGHLAMAARAREELALDEVRFMPCRISPHKEGTPPASASDRLEMLRLATAGLPWARVDAYEAERHGVSYSYETAEALCVPGVLWYWIMGGDQWLALPQWRHPERLAARVEFIVFGRHRQPVSPRPGYRLHFVPWDHPASATAIREALLHGAVAPPWLPPAVARWIARRGIYRGTEG